MMTKTEDSKELRIETIKACEEATDATNLDELKDIAGAVGKLIEKDMAENGVGRECAKQRVFALIRDKLENAH